MVSEKLGIMPLPYFTYCSYGTLLNNIDDHLKYRNGYD